MKTFTFRRISRIGAAAGLFLAIIGGTAGVAFAATSNTVVSGTTNHTVYASGQAVTITGTINGDVFCAGQTVNVDADVNGDVICAGQTVTVDGTVHGDIRLAGETVNVGAQVDDNASVIAQDAVLQSNAQVNGDFGVAAQTVTLDGQTGRDVKATAANMTLNGTVGRNMSATVGLLTLTSHSVIGNDLTYTSPNVAKMTGDAAISGTVTYHHKASQGNSQHIMWRGPAIFGHLYLILALLIFGLVLAAFFPRFFDSWNQRAGSRFWLSLLTGFIAMFAVPFLIVALLLSIIGIPLAIFIALLWALAVMLSAPLAAFYVGRLILSKDRHPTLVMLVGGLVLGLVTLIPVLGWIIGVAALWFGTGSVLLNLKHMHRKPEAPAVQV